jgi:hypothetical protein
MTTTEYRMTTYKVLGKSLMIWIFMSVQLLVNIILIMRGSSVVTDFILMNLVFGLFSIAGLILHLNYYRKSKNRTIVLTPDMIFMKYKEQAIVELVQADITKIVVHETGKFHRLPWIGYRYFWLSDGKKRIVIPNYIIDIKEFLSDPLSNDINRKWLKKESSGFPFID